MKSIVLKPIVAIFALLCAVNTALAQTPAPAEPPQHDLMGKWGLLWLDSGNRNAFNIRSVQVKNGYTDIVEATVTSAQEQCPMIATIWDRATAVLPMPGPPRKPDMQIAVPSYIIMQINCADVAVEITALGSPSRKAAMVGRAVTTFKKTGQAVVEAVLMGRE